jgi:WD40 repeat protein
MRVQMTTATAMVMAVLTVAADQTKPQPPDRPIRTTGTRGLVHFVAFAPDNTTVLAWDSAGFARWNPETGKTVDRQPVIAKACAEHRAPLIPRTEDGRTAAANCAGKLAFFEIATGATRGEYKFDPKLTPTVYTQSPDGALLATVPAGALSTIHIIDIKTGERRAQIQNEQEVQQLSFSPSGGVLAAGAVDGVRLWQIADSKLSHLVPGGGSHTFSADGKWLALERGRDVAVVDVGSGAVKQTFPAAVSQVRFSTDGTMLAGWNNQQLIVWNLASGKAVLSLKSSQLVTMAFSPDGNYLTAVAMDLMGGGAQTTLGVWRIPK